MELGCMITLPKKINITKPILKYGCLYIPGRKTSVATLTRIPVVIRQYQDKDSWSEYEAVIDNEGCCIANVKAPRDGYPCILVEGNRNTRLHRYVYELENGTITEVDDKGQLFVVDHLCQNPLCCKPSHLQAVSNRINSLRGDITKNRKLSTKCKHGHEYTNENVYIMPNGGRGCKACRKEISRQSYLHSLQKKNNEEKEQRND